MNKMVSKKNILNIFYFLTGIVIFSVAFTFFLLPHDLVFGGVSGLSIIFNPANICALGRPDRRPRCPWFLPDNRGWSRSWPPVRPAHGGSS